MNTISSLFLVAYFFPIALPPTVKDEINELFTKVVRTTFINKEFAIYIDNIAPQEPLIIPHISPITSLHILAILGEFLINLTRSF